MKKYLRSFVFIMMLIIPEYIALGINLSAAEPNKFSNIDFVTINSSLLSCDIPGNFVVAEYNSCSVKLKWLPVTGIDFYKVGYRITGTSSWTIINQITDTFFVVAGLISNTDYQFRAAGHCLDGSNSTWTPIVTAKTIKCSTPLNLSVTNITLSSADISWVPPCGSPQFRLQFRILGTTGWNTVSGISTTTFTLSGLNSQTSYQFRVAALCLPYKSTWSSFGFFTTTIPNSPANILLIMLDDCRYDAFAPNGAPQWFESPAINSIAYEGANFKITCPATPSCAPSRASVYTGLYGHENGCAVNGEEYISTLPLINQILNDYGYYTGFVGKYGQGFPVPSGYDWYANSSNLYVNATYNINGSNTYIPGHITDVYEQLALDYLNSIPADTPFLFLFNQRVPHIPSIPRDEEDSLYLNENMPLPNNLFPYEDDYPNFLGATNSITAYEADSILERTFQCLSGVDKNVDAILTWLQDHNQLDNTLIVFTSDNGRMIGEHALFGKRACQEEAIRVPLFIRYPNWFNDSTIIADQIASTIDFAPTFLEAAGITDTFGFPGISLHALANNQPMRQQVLIEGGADAILPAFRAVRTLSYKYNYYFCDSLTEEFYDLVNDPSENINQINNPDYLSLVNMHRDMLDSLRQVYGDTLDPAITSCYLVNNIFPKMNNEDEIEAHHSPVTIIPNPASEQATILIRVNGEAAVTLSLLNSIGQTIEVRHLGFKLNGIQNEMMNTSLLPKGIYFVDVKIGRDNFRQKMVVQ